MSRALTGKAHLVAGFLALGLIATFWTGTMLVELFGDAGAVAAVKGAILWGMLLLVPAMATVGGSGFRLGGRSRAPIVAAKRRRMMAIALNGLLVLVPSAIFLAGRAADGRLDTAFYAVQAVELVAGALNLGLMALNIRDGFAMTRHRRQGAALMPSSPA